MLPVYPIVDSFYLHCGFILSVLWFHFIIIVVSFYSYRGFVLSLYWFYLSLFCFHLSQLWFHFNTVMLSCYPYCGFILSVLWFHVILIVISAIPIVVSFHPHYELVKCHQYCHFVNINIFILFISHFLVICGSNDKTSTPPTPTNYYPSSSPLKYRFIILLRCTICK